MRIFAIADLHLSFGTPNKEMDIFGPAWKDHPKRLSTHWKERIAPSDLVLLPGDISWGKRVEDALPDLAFIDSLPGTKVMIRGNHDYWWPSASKLNALPFPSIRYIHNNSLRIGPVAIAGTRLWDNDAIDLSDYFDMAPSLWTHRMKPEENEKIYTRELLRLDESLKQLDQTAPLKICMVHYPPLGPNLASTPASDLMEKYHIDHCLFGHLHGLAKDPRYASKNGITYHLTSCDYLECIPKQIV